MHAYRLRAVSRSFFILAFTSLLLPGCGSNALTGEGNGANNPGIEPAGADPDTLFAEVDDPELGNYELVARSADEKTGTWNFAVRSTRNTAKNQLRFVWDFGDGPAGEGTELSHQFTADGSYLITVTAYKADNTVAFLLKLTVEVRVDSNQAPLAVAGDDQVVNENDLVFLFGGESSDPDNDEITYSWSQTFGPAVQILHANEASASFVSPLVSADTDLVFRLTVSDGELTGTDDVAVRVVKLLDPAGVALNVDAGADQQVSSGQPVTLNSATDPSDSAVVFEWSQFQGPAVAMAGTNRSTTTFVAPSVAAGSAVQLGFEVIATLQNASAVDEVMVTVNGPSGSTPPPGGGGGSGGTDPCLADSDNDSLNDCVDLCPNDPRKGAPGICGCGVADTDGDGDATPDCNDSCPSDPQKVTAGLCGCGVPETPGCGSPTGCVTSLTTWRNTTMSAQTGPFVASFEATPSGSGIDAVVALSRGPASTFSSCAAIVRFNPSGTVDVRNGGSYGAASAFPYAGGERIRFRIVVDTAGKRYDVFATRTGGVETTLASGFAFRTEQNTVTSLDNWSAWADTGTTLTVCGFSLSAPALAASAGSDATIAPGGSTPLAGSASGGTPPYTYRWSPSTGLSNANIANPTASPAATTTYSLTVTDAASATANSLVTVTVQAVTLAANAGPDRSIAPGGSASLSGSASGGTAPYTYRWTPTTGLNNANIASPTASPSATTTYTLTVTDSQSRTATDSAVVTVTSVPTGNVFYVATNGNDSNPGTEASPWRTLTKAGNTARAGETVYVKAGTYSDVLTPVNSGAEGNLIRFLAFPSQACVRSTDYQVRPTCQVILTGGIDLNRKSYVRVEGFEIVGASVRESAGVYCQSRDEQLVHHVEIVNNYIRNCGNGVVCRNAIDTLIADNYIRDLGEISPGAGIGIRGDRNAQNVTIRNNVILNVGCDGMDLQGINVVIEQNVVGDSFNSGCHQDALEIYPPVRGMIIRNNLIYDFTQLIYGGPFPGDTNPMEDIEIYGNVLYTNRYWTVRGGEAPGIFFDGTQSSTAPIRRLKIHSNTIAWVGYGAIWLHGNAFSDITIRNNIFAEASVDVSSTAQNVTSDYNLFWGVSKPPFEGTHSKIGNPLFENYVRYSSYDLRIKAGSPAIDAGLPSLGSVVPLPVPFVDRDAKTRPRNVTYDMGAYEW